MKNKFLWLSIILAVVLGLIWQFSPLKNGQARMNLLPLKGSTFYGKDIPISEAEKNSFINVNILKRLYKVGSDTFFITVLDGTQNRHAIHDPRFCFRGDGWEVVSEKNWDDGNIFTLIKNRNKRDALVWYTDGKNRFSSPFEYWWRTSLRRLTFGKSGDEPLLVLIQPIDNPKPDWEKFKKNFPELFEL